MAATTPPRRQAPFILGLILILAALPLGYFLFLHKPPPPAPPPPPATPPAAVEEKAPEKPQVLTIGEVKGEVEIRRADGTWEPAKPGRVLLPSEALRTQGGASALLQGESVNVNLEASTEMSLEEISANASKFLLANGMATASVKSGIKHTLEMRATGSDASATTTQEGTFTMSNDGAGTVAVGTRAGEVTFKGNGKIVIVRAGYQSVLRPGSSAPTEPVKIPSSLLRKVQWPSARQNKRKIIVQGEAEPGTRLELAGETFSPGHDGAFTRTVELKEGENDVKLKVSSVGGTQDEASQKFHVDTTPPSKLKVNVDWGTSQGQTPPHPNP